jgi:hypothetical protein
MWSPSSSSTRLRAGKSSADLGIDATPVEDVLSELPDYFKAAGFTKAIGRDVARQIPEDPPLHGLYVLSTRTGSPAGSRVNVDTVALDSAAKTSVIFDRFSSTLKVP